MVMTDLSLQLFGVPRIRLNDTDLRISRRKSLALLAYLSVNQRCNRNALATLFWPEASGYRAMANLRNAIYALGETPIRRWILADRDSVSLEDQASINIDVREFHQHIATECPVCVGANQLCETCVERLNRIVALHGDGFLFGFSVTGSPDFEQWQYHESQYYLRECVKAMKRLAEHYEMALKWDQAVEHSRRLTELEPLDETGWRSYIKILTLAGCKNEALVQFQRLKMLLKEELDIPPDPETENLMIEVESGRISSLPGPRKVELSNLPLPVTQTPFVGRSSEVSQLTEILLESTHRLVTILGPGGCGKSRLALQVATDIRRRFKDGVVWITFSLEDPSDAIGMRIAQALRLNAASMFSSPEPGVHTDLFKLKTQLILHLQNRELLLILDNFDTLSGSCGILAEMISAAPGVQFLLTSRRRTNLHGEWVFHTDGLRVPGNDDPETVAQSDAVRLFCQAARQAQHSFRLNPDNIDIVAELCRILQGIPLALEMAAAWVRVLDPGDIVDEIRENLDFLSTSTQDLPVKHRSLRAIFQQTWDGLPLGLQQLFKSLSVFSGGFSRGAALEICNATYSDLANLIDRSVLRRVDANRYEIHELLRQYAGQLLRQEIALNESVTTDHENYYMALLKQTAQSLTRGDQPTAFRLMSLENANLRAAWIHAASRGDIHNLRSASMAMFLYFDQKYYFQQGYEVFHAASRVLDLYLAGINRPASTDIAIFNGLSIGLQGWFLRYSLQQKLTRETTVDSTISEARQMMDDALELLEPFSDQWEWALIRVLDIFSRNPWQDTETLPLLDQCIDIFKNHHDSWGHALAIVCKGCWHWNSDLDKSLAYQQEAMEIREEAGDRWGYSQSCVSVGHVLLKMGNFPAAEEMFLKGLKLTEELGENPNGHVEVLSYLGCTNYETGNYSESLRYFQKSLDISRTMNNLYRTARLYGNLGYLNIKCMHYSEALNALNKCLELSNSAGFTKLHDHFQAALKEIPEEKRSGTVLGR